MYIILLKKIDEVRKRVEVEQNGLDLENVFT